MKIATLTSTLFLAWTQTASDHNMGRGGQMALSLDQVKPVIQKYVDDWKTRNPQNPLWVSLASPGDPINVPGVTFGTAVSPKAGMELPIHAHLIVLNRNMVPESILTTFTHEYGHAQYRVAHPNDFQEIGSEIAALKSSLTILPSEGFEYLAHREASAFKEMARDEPYRSAVARLAADPLWRKYSERPQ